jgi:DNA (cytosine-5)-methyltransferase 1
VLVAQKKDPARLTTVDRSRLMSRVRQKNTTLEVEVRHLVHSLGFRFRINGKGLPGSPDLVNRKSRWAIFVHGCYWHAHEGCHLWKIPANNRQFWEQKFRDNRRRDLRNVEELENLGYKVLVVWQCELADREALTARLLAFLVPRPTEGISVAYLRLTGGNRVARVMAAVSEVDVTIQEATADDPASEEDPGAAFDRGFLRGLPRKLPELCDPAIRVADLFCGCGGLSLGIREACWATGRRFVSALAVDNDAGALEVYRKNFSPLQSSSENLEVLLDHELGDPPSVRERRSLATVGSIDILVAGPPCQGHSDLNNQTRRSDPRNRLYERVGRFVELVRPKHVLIENVPGVVHDRAGALKRTAQHLKGLGYHVDSGIVDLVQLGVPQRRRRHVLVASLSGSVAIESVLDKYCALPRGVEWAIRDLESRSADDLLDTASRPTAENLERINYLLQNDEYDLPNHLRPVCHRNEDHTYKSMYGRLSWSEPAQTITSGFGSPGQGRFIHPSQPRVLTPREAARLQFFPDSFSFKGVEKRTQLAQLIGNAVPMKLSWIFCLEFLVLDSKAPLQGEESRQ